MSLYKGTTLIAGKTPVPTGAMKYKGSCLQADLPTSGRDKGDYWKLSDTTGEYQGQCAIWNGDAWDYSTSNINIDNSFSLTSTNPVENKIITAAINSFATKTELNDGLALKQDVIEDLITIRSGAALGTTSVQPEAGKGLFSGNYNDLTNKPTLFSGNYNDLTNKPSLNFLPLAGGTMTGSISLGDQALKSGSDSGRLNLRGGSGNWETGASIELYGKSNSTLKGGFKIIAHNGTSSSSLQGQFDGMLYWNSKKVLTTADQLPEYCRIINDDAMSAYYKLCRIDTHAASYVYNNCYGMDKYELRIVRDGIADGFVTIGADSTGNIGSCVMNWADGGSHSSGAYKIILTWNSRYCDIYIQTSSQYQSLGINIVSGFSRHNHLDYRTSITGWKTYNQDQVTYTSLGNENIYNIF